MNRLQQNIQIPKTAIKAFCDRHHVQHLSFFGSVLTDAFRPDSDIDVLVDFDPAHIPGLIRFLTMEAELSDILGRSVDLHTPQSLSAYIREQVIREANVSYSA